MDFINFMNFITFSFGFSAEIISEIIAAQLTPAAFHLYLHGIRNPADSSLLTPRIFLSRVGCAHQKLGKMDKTISTQKSSGLFTSLMVWLLMVWVYIIVVRTSLGPSIS